MLVDLTDSESSSSQSLKTQRAITNRINLSASSKFLENQNNSSSWFLSRRLHRAAAKHARHPGFFRSAYFDSDSEVE